MLFRIGSQNTKISGLLILVLLAFASAASAQTIGVNERGDSILVFSDGSWRYFDAVADQHLLKKPGEEEVTAPIAKQEPITPKPAKKAQKVKKQKPPKPSKAKKTKPKKSKQKKTKQKKSKAKKPAVAKNSKNKAKKQKKASSAENIALETKMREEAIARAELAAAEASMKQQTTEDLSFDLLMLEEELKNAYSSTSTTDSDIIEMEQKIQKKRSEEEMARAEYEKTARIAEFYNKLIELPEDKRQKMLAKEYEKSGKRKEVSIAIENAEPDLVPALKLESTATSSEQLKVEKKIQKAADLILYPPTPDCPEIEVGYNEFTGKKRISMAPAPFFHKTPEQMRRMLKDREYLEAFANLEKVANVTFLQLKIVISSSTAQNDYGLIEKGSRLTIKFIDGTTVPVFATTTVQGELNNLEKTVTYKVNYHLDKGVLKTLRKGEIDKIRLIWLTGFEDYDIYDVDFLAMRIDCLQN